VCPYAGALQALRELAGSLLAGMVFILVKDDEDRTVGWIAKLGQLSGCQICTDRASGVAKAGLTTSVDAQVSLSPDKRGARFAAPYRRGTWAARDGRERPAARDERERPAARDGRERPAARDGRERLAARDEREKLAARDGREKLAARDEREKLAARDEREKLAARDRREGLAARDRRERPTATAKARQSAYWRKHAIRGRLIDVQVAEVGRLYSGAVKSDDKRGPKFRAPYRGYSLI
jgi:hypothetical protein